MEIVDSLQKTELAEMAESLVNITSIKRHFSKGSETVGGPIDVAVITKGDGLIWIKRKHYFDAKLNNHFLHNYFQEAKKMNDIYKNINEYLKEVFPNAYNEKRNSREISLDSYIKKTSNDFKSKIDNIINKKSQTAHNRSVNAGVPFA
jgi:hypothetical protein